MTTATATHKCFKCDNDATGYWHDATPLGAGTFWGCDRHAPNDASWLDGEVDDWRDNPWYADRGEANACVALRDELMGWA